MLGALQYNNLVSLNCTKLLSKSRKCQSVKMEYKTSKINSTLRNWITLNKSQFLVKNSLFHRRAASLDQKKHEYIKTIEINFKNPKNKRRSVQPKTRCDSTGSVGSQQQKIDEQTRISFNKLHITDGKNKYSAAQVFKQMENPQRCQRINQIKGLKLQSTGYRVRKIDLGPSSIYVRGTRIR